MRRMGRKGGRERGGMGDVMVLRINGIRCIRWDTHKAVSQFPETNSLACGGCPGPSLPLLLLLLRLPPRCLPSSHFLCASFAVTCEKKWLLQGAGGGSNAPSL